MWFTNLDTIPAGQSYYTLYVTAADEGTPRSQMNAEEVDVIAPSGLEWTPLANTDEVKQALLDTFGDAWIDTRIVGIVNQSSGFVVFDAFAAGIETGANDL